METNLDAQRPVLPVLAAEGIVKHFPGITALKDVSIDITPGEVHALTGENGSGKSTLAKVLTGVVSPNSGTVLIDGSPADLRDPGQALAKGVVLISQELTLAPTLSVAENVYMGRLPMSRGKVQWAQVNAATRATLAAMDIDARPKDRVGDLSIEVQQELEIARAFTRPSRVLVLDEASSSLSEAAADKLMRLIEQKRAEGVAVVMITHRMAEIFRVCDRATVLRDGALIGTVKVAETTESQLIRMMVGRDIGGYFGTPSPFDERELVTLRDFQTLDGSVQSLSLSLSAGEIFGVAGLAGSGKSEFAQALAGSRASSGEVRVADKPVNLTSPATAMAAGVGYVPDDRKRLGILANRPVLENLLLSPTKSVGRPNSPAERKRGNELIKEYGVATRSVRQLIGSLSGGNQQKVVIARTLERAPELLVLNEPTRGVDVGARSDIYDIIRARASAGAAVVLVSSELPELLGLSNRIAVFFERKLVSVVPAAEATEELLAHLCVAGTELAPGQEEQ